MEFLIQGRPDVAQDANVRLSHDQPQLASELASHTGGALNPIIVTDSSPPSKRKHGLKDQHRQKPGPHLFLGRGIEKLYSSRPSRPALAPKPANGSTFTGHLNHDIYRMMNAKTAARQDWNMHGYNFQDMPFEVQYPVSAQYLQQRTTPKLPVPYAHYPNYQSPANKYALSPAQDKHQVPASGHTVLPAESEELLRSRAIQYIREFHWPKNRKRRLSEIDPDETSLSESGQPMPVPKTSPLKPVPRPAFTTATSPLVDTNTRPHPNRKLTVYRDENSHFELTQLTDHNELLTSLLKLYPHSNDQKGLREDISMLVSVQNQRVGAWMKSEKGAARKKRKMLEASQMALNRSWIAEVAALKAHQERKKMKQDKEVGQFLSAEANLWQDGSGQGVADVFAEGFGLAMRESVDDGIESSDEESED